MKTKYFKMELVFAQAQTLKSVVQKIPYDINYIRIKTPFMDDYVIDTRLHRLIWRKGISVNDPMSKRIEITQITQQEYLNTYVGGLFETAQNFINQNTNKQ